MRWRLVVLRPEWTQEDPQLHASSYQHDYYNATTRLFKNAGAKKKNNKKKHLTVHWEL